MTSIFCIAAAFALAVWSIYLDLGRRARHPTTAEPIAAADLPARGTGDGLLYVGLGMLAVSWLMNYLADRWGSWLEGAAGMALAAGAVLLGLHLARARAAPSAESGNRPDRG